MATALNSKISQIIPLMFIVFSFSPFADGEVVYLDDDVITATASLLRGSYTLGQKVPIDIAATNHGQKSVYIDVDEFGYLGLWVTVEDVNGNKVEHGPVPSPPAPPRHWWITVDGKKIFTVPVVEIEPGQTIKLTIQDALSLYHGYLQEGVYYVKPGELSVIHKVNSVIIREDQEHKLWIDPYTVISRGRYEINKVEITLRQGKIIYVDDNGPADFNTIQAAIDASIDSDIVLVAPGTYTGDGNWDIDFKGKAILVKSEEGPESCIIVCNLSQPLSGRPPHSVSHRGFNFHSNEDANSIVCGFTVTRGDDRNYKNEGGAFYCEESSPTIRDCIIVCNEAESGGGIWARNSRMYVSNCIITGNLAAGYGEGGGICLISGETCFVSCTISGNMARSVYHGCGVYSEGGNHQFINCTITGNRVRGERGGCGILFRAARENAICDLTNCIVWGNHAGSEDYEIRLRQSTGVVPISMELRIKHCLIGEDTSDIHDSYGMVSGNWLMTDPMFARNGYWDPNGTSEDLSDDFWIDGDYHLKSQAGRWDPVSESLIQDDVTSPCIDAGDPNMPVGDEPEPNGGRINMGAYGGTSQASKSYILSKIIYVDDDAIGLNNGSSWRNAYTFLQDALYDAETSEKPVEIRVAQGVYRPDQGWCSDGRPEFRLRNDWILLGGYAGIGQANSNDRDLKKYKTVLSGDVNSDDAIPDNIEGLVEELTRTDNIHDVVHTSFTDESLLLDGFIITGAISHGMVTYDSSCRISNCVFMHNSSDSYGGALRTEGHNSIGPMITCCRFIKNVSSKAGGAVLNSCFTTFITCDFIGNISEDGGALSNYKDVELIDCIFESNVAETGGALKHSSFATMVLDGCIFRGNHVRHNSDSPQSVVTGGAVYIKESNTVITNCDFWTNSTSSTGGAIAAHDASVTISNCAFSGNQADQQGGAVYGRFASIQFNTCEFSGNSTDTDGAAIYAVKTFPDYIFGLHLNNCTLADNIALNGRGIACKFYSGGGIRNSPEDAVQAIFSDYKVSKDLAHVYISNNIINNGGNEIFNPDGLQIMIRYTDFFGGSTSIHDPCNAVIWGMGNIDENPLFVDPGYWDPNGTPDDPNDDFWAEGDYHLKSQAGRWDPVSESWIHDDVTSPCIDAGDPNSPIGHEPFPNGGIINMGAYGGTPEASLSPLIGQASNPNPPDGAFGVSPNIILSWSPGKDAVSHDIYFGLYFGLTPSPGFVNNQIETNFNPGQLYPQGMLPSLAQCYWRIDEIDSQGNITTGDVWTFQVHEYKGRLCFTGQTPVWINDSLIPISKVNIGQSINGINRIEEVQEHEGTYTLYDILLESGNCITVAENHIFMTESGKWLSLHKLKAGMRLKTLNGSIGIQSITKRPSPYTGKVYNLKIQGSDQYIVGKDMVIVRDY